MLLVNYMLENDNNIYEGVAYIVNDSFILYDYSGVNTVKQDDLLWVNTCSITGNKSVKLFP